MSESDGKKSWKEIDAARNRGGGARAPKKLSKEEERTQKLASNAAKSDLEKLFANSPLNKEKAAKMNEIQSLRGRPQFYEKMNEYLKAYGVPLEWEIQLLFLDHRDSRIVLSVLAELQKTAPTFPLEKQDLLAKKLNVMELSTFDYDLSAAIQSLKKTLLR